MSLHPCCSHIISSLSQHFYHGLSLMADPQKKVNLHTDLEPCGNKNITVLQNALKNKEVWKQWNDYQIYEVT